MDNPEDLSDCELDSCARVRLVLDVPVSPSSVCDVSPCGSDWEFVEPQSFSLPKAYALWYRYAGRDEARRLTSESTPAFKKKSDTANTNAKFVFLLREGPRKV